MFLYKTVSAVLMPLDRIERFYSAPIKLSWNLTTKAFKAANSFESQARGLACIGNLQQEH